MRWPLREPSQTSAACHGSLQDDLDGLPLVAIVGPPNVGKSLLFNRLTGSYVSVSNYPGTTVEISRGKMAFPCCDGHAGVIDTPGMFSLFPITEEERVARRILLSENPSVLINVLDAKNLERLLPLTMQLIEGDLPVLLVLNMLDEARWLGLEIELCALSSKLGIPVVGTACTTGLGLAELRGRLHAYVHSDCSL